VAVPRDRQGQRPGVRLHGLLALAGAGMRRRGAVALLRGSAQVGGPCGFPRPRDDACGPLLQQPMRSQHVLRGRSVFAPCVSQGFVLRMDTGHLVLLGFGLIEDNQ